MSDEQANWMVISAAGQWRMMRTDTGAIVLLSPTFLSRCEVCKNPLLPPLFKVDGFGSFWWEHSRKELGIREAAHSKLVDDICTQCAAEGVTFKCSACKETRNADQLYEAIGDPADFLCLPCYETVPAKKWDELMKQLRQQHQHDYC